LKFLGISIADSDLWAVVGKNLEMSVTKKLTNLL